MREDCEPEWSTGVSTGKEDTGRAEREREEFGVEVQGSAKDIILRVLKIRHSLPYAVVALGLSFAIPDYIAAGNQKFGIETCEQLQRGKTEDTGRIEAFMRNFKVRTLADFVAKCDEVTRKKQTLFLPVDMPESPIHPSIACAAKAVTSVREEELRLLLHGIVADTAAITAKCGQEEPQPAPDPIK